MNRKEREGREDLKSFFLRVLSGLGGKKESVSHGGTNA